MTETTIDLPGVIVRRLAGGSGAGTPCPMMTLDGASPKSAIPREAEADLVLL